ncbi:hypothetical protein FDE04_24860 [Vibrio parahaemolyticus]|uniref:hypothetical protein n=1 Tax=Vibrio parahaemolyticus TaxID=670 RepID=UPI0004082A3A|nr:hypothetical protein [Vibrio parahaemolyticus]EGQ8166844.1 hypothetical protein [Vibrio parahaemolyticus]EGR0998059.1 hypothetical protein [Vibrio parahaemolyticus]EGR3441890.1 hypothetical protein [Vibrio parahaemolyticus]MBA5885372.1 hypothetical protein [Vibrio parahaemolyticus]MBA5889910.1 hypothetical protein [Vibrio parahaemolyticus]
MKAVVVGINPSVGMYAAEIDGSGEYVIFELLDTDEPEMGDVIVHSDFYSLGGETYKNQAQGCSIDVYVQNVCDKNTAKQMLA